MSHPTSPRHNRSSAAALVLVVAVLLAGCEPRTDQPTDLNPAPVPVEVQDAPRESDVEFSASCDSTGFAYDIEPSTVEAQQAARQFCRNADAAIDQAEWPAGLRPLGDVAVDK